MAIKKPIWRKPTIHVDEDTGEEVHPERDIAILKYEKDEYIHHEDYIERQSIKFYKLYGKQKQLF